MKKFLLFFFLLLSTTFLVGCDLSWKIEKENEVLKENILTLQEQISWLNSQISGLNEYISWLNEQISGLNSHTYELEKQIIPTEFSIDKNKYEVSYFWEKTVLNEFQDNDIWWLSEYDNIIWNLDPSCKNFATWEAYNDWLKYFRNLFKNYTNEDKIKIYEIKDKTLKEKSNKERWIKIFVMKNKLWYSSTSKFIKDFYQNCEIPFRNPRLISSNYALFISCCNCGNTDSLECENWIDKKLIKDIVLN